MGLNFIIPWVLVHGEHYLLVDESIPADYFTIA
jgi:hypothetical protein